MLYLCQHVTVQAEFFSCRPLARDGLCTYECASVSNMQFSQIQECEMGKRHCFIVTYGKKC